jgi:hypothetical protein
MADRPDPATLTEGRGLAVGIYTAAAGLDDTAAWAVTADADPEQLRVAALSLAFLMAGVVGGYAAARGENPLIALPRSAEALGLLIHDMEAPRG